MNDHLNAEPQLFVGHLHSPEVVLHLSGSLDVLLHAFNILHRGPQNSAFIPAHIPECKWMTVKCLSLKISDKIWPSFICLNEQKLTGHWF